MEKRSLTNLLLGVVIFGMVAGAGVGIALNYKSVASTVNGWMGDAQKVTFTQIVKKANYGFNASYTGIEWNATEKDGVFTIDNSAGTTAMAVYGTGYRGGSVYFEKGAHDLNGFAIYYFSVKALSTKVVGSSVITYLGPNSTFSCTTSELNVWKKASTCVLNVSGYFSYYDMGTKALAGDVLKFGDYQLVDLSPLGLWNVSEACAVFEKLTKGEYFEGDKTFTKGEIKKAISDYEAEQKAASTSVASTASASAAASSNAA